MPRPYRIKPLIWLVKDEASVKFHVASDDYFGTIATVLNLLKQQIKKGGNKDSARLDKVWNNLEDDLSFLQKNYQIKPRTKNKKRTPKGKVKNQ